MPFNTDRNYGQLLTAAVAKRSREIQDIVYNATPLTAILLDMRNRAEAGLSNSSGRIKERRAGGPELRIPVNFDKLTAQWFTGYDKLEITPKELLGSAVFNWSRVVSMFSLNGSELLYTSGEEEIIDLLTFHAEAAEKAVKESFETAIVGDGTADGGRQMIGLGAAVPTVTNTGIYGGIDRGNIANWRTTTYNIVSGDVSGYNVWDSTTARPIIDRITLARSRGRNYPKLYIADALAWEAISAATVAHQRIVDERLGRLGFQGYVWETPAGPVSLMAAGGIGNVMPANTIYGLDPDTWSLYTFPGQEFVPFHPGDGLRPINQDAIAQGIVWSGQLVMENPLFNVRIRTTS